MAFAAHAEGSEKVSEGTMQNLLIVLVVLTMACGAAASVTIALAPAYADDSGGY
jgi:hypothetical protein